MSAMYRRLFKANKSLVKKLVGISGMDEGLVQNFVYFTQCMVEPNHGYIDKAIFYAVLVKYFNLTDQRLVFRTFFKYVDVKGKDLMTVESFCQMLCMFFSKDDDKVIDYIFGMIDLNGDGTLHKPELELMIMPCKCLSDLDELDKQDTFMDLCNMVWRILDIEKTFYLSYENFKKRVKEENLLTTVLGQILPASTVTDRFLGLIKGKTYREMKDLFGTIRYDLLYEINTVDEFKYYPLKLDMP